MRYAHLARPDVLGLHVFPDLCQPDKVKAVPADFKTDNYDVDLSKHVISLSTPFTAFLPTGAANRPQLASAERSAALFGGIRDDRFNFFGEYRSPKEHRSDGDMGAY